jgi:hypothetical protein
MKKSLMILTMGLFLGTIGYTSTAVAGEPEKTEKKDCKDDCKKDCCKDNKKGEEKSAEAKKACSSKEGKKACCSKKKD